MSSSRLLDYLDHMQQATADVSSFVDGLNHADFLNDKRTQQAVIMNLIIIGEAATKVMERYAAFTQAHPEVPWHSMRGMRNRMTHGYFDVDLNVVWETAQRSLPELRKKLLALHQEAVVEHRNNQGMAS